MSCNQWDDKRRQQDSKALVRVVSSNVGVWEWQRGHEKGRAGRRVRLLRAGRLVLRAGWNGVGWWGSSGLCVCVKGVQMPAGWGGCWSDEEGSWVLRAGRGAGRKVGRSEGMLTTQTGHNHTGKQGRGQMEGWEGGRVGTCIKQGLGGGMGRANRPGRGVVGSQVARVGWWNGWGGYQRTVFQTQAKGQAGLVSTGGSAAGQACCICSCTARQQLQQQLATRCWRKESGSSPRQRQPCLAPGQRAAGVGWRAARRQQQEEDNCHGAACCQKHESVLGPRIQGSHLLLTHLVGRGATVPLAAAKVVALEPGGRRRGLHAALHLRELDLCRLLEACPLRVQVVPRPARCAHWQAPRCRLPASDCSARWPRADGYAAAKCKAGRHEGHSCNGGAPG